LKILLTIVKITAVTAWCAEEAVFINCSQHLDEAGIDRQEDAREKCAIPL
jgi:hypothetical protein